MTDEARRKEVRSIIDKVRQVLLQDWDPLWVGGNPYLSDEYDLFLPEIMKLLRDDPEPAEIADLLRRCCQSIETGSDDDATVRAADALLALRRGQPAWPSGPS